MSRVETTTNFKDEYGADLGTKLVTKDYLISVYPEIGDKIGIPPELWSWGNNYGRLGTNDTTNRFTPVTTFSGGANWKQVSTSRGHTAAIKTDGTLWVWGVNTYGVLGINNTLNRLTPVTTFAGGTNWKQVVAGSNLTAAIKTDGTLWTWGAGNDGALGNAQTSNRLTPVTTFAGGTNWKQVSALGNDLFSPPIGIVAAIKTDGTLWVWGSGRYSFGTNSFLGTNDALHRSTPSTTFAGGNDWKQVSVGVGMAAIKTDGTLWTWGANSSGELGINNTTHRSTPVTTFAGGNNWKQVVRGQYNMTAIKTDGTLWNCGNNGQGQLGVTDTTNRQTPVTTFAGGNNWKQSDLVGLSMAAIKTDGTLWVWGLAAGGQLGTNDDTPNRSTPVTTFAGGNNWKQVSSGGYATVAVQSVDFSPF
jgi:alpha-tubulin suppressor-like RCC1 family protein